MKPFRPAIAWFVGLSFQLSLVVFLAPSPVLAQGTTTTPSTQVTGTDSKSVTAGDKINQSRFSIGSWKHYYFEEAQASEPTYLYFPPVPPPLDTGIPVLAPFVSAMPAPPELANYVGELFYPMLATRLAADDLAKSVRTQLQAYRTTKLALQNELRSRIAAFKDLPPTQHEQELAAFAELQHPLILELEDQAEEIRNNLRSFGLFGWPAEATTAPEISTASKEVTVDQPTTPENLLLESRFFRYAAFYFDGFSAGQRRLLLEMAIELTTQAHPVPVSSQTAKEGWMLHFSPEAARIRLVDNLPAPLAKKISEYRSIKQGLKSELRETLIAYDNTNKRARANAMKALAMAQVARLASLELAAEEIRRDLADLPNPPGPPPPPPLPAELLTRISAYRTHKIEILKALYAMLTSSGITASPAPPGGVASNAQSWIHDGTTQTDLLTKKSRGAISEFNSTQTRLLDELNKEQAGIREALAAHFRQTNQPTDRKSINDLLKDFESSRQKQEIWEKYRDYQTAVLMPGLSPEQRRLLFDAAIVLLALPLPAGEKLP